MQDAARFLRLFARVSPFCLVLVRYHHPDVKGSIAKNLVSMNADYFLRARRVLKFLLESPRSGRFGSVFAFNALILCGVRRLCVRQAGSPPVFREKSGTSTSSRSTSSASVLFIHDGGVREITLQPLAHIDKFPETEEEPPPWQGSCPITIVPALVVALKLPLPTAPVAPCSLRWEHFSSISNDGNRRL